MKDAEENMLTIGVIGAGYWGKNIIRAFNNLKSVKLKYIVDSDQDVLNKFKNLYDVEKLKDYKKILQDEDVDAVAVVTSAHTHFDIAKDCLLAGKHVFVEKPMTLKVEHAQELVNLAEEKNLKLMVGHLLLYHPCINTLKEFIDKEEIGKPFYIYCDRLNLGKIRKDENALLSLAPHDISVAIYLFGENPLSVSAYGQCYLQKDIEDVVFLNMLFPGNKIAHIHVSWLDPHKVRRTTVVGSKKMIVFDDMEPREKVKVYDKGFDMTKNYDSYDEFLQIRDGDIHIPAVKMSEPLKLECEHFLKSIEEDFIPRSDGYNGLAVTQVLDAGIKSIKNSGIPVKIGEK
ncbi:MAG TPA: Gfo/Idh/MocA family oxidoreductase [bacterium]|nr:Gfo/Idh/MocA family oxidoreductase [bacterium]